MSTAHRCATDTGDAPIRYTLLDGRVGVPSRGAYLRALAESTFWLGAASIPARLLWRAGAHRTSARVQRWWARRIIAVIGLRIDWQGLDLIDPAEAYVVTPLHEGLVDALALIQLPLPLRFVLRDEFEDWPLVGGYLRDTGQVAIRPEDGTNAYRQMVRGAREVVEGGESLVVCPQGTILGIETDFNAGAFAVARTLGRPILPIALTGSHRVWEFPFSPRLRRGERMSVRVLPPIPASEVRDQDVDEIRRDVQRQLKGEALDGTMAPPRRFVPARDGYWEGFAYEIDPAFPALAADVAAHREGLVDHR